MSTVVTDELITELLQPLIIDVPTNVACIKVYLLAQSPDADSSVKLELLKDGYVLFSKELLFSEMKAMLKTTNTNLHGLFPFRPPGSLYLSPGIYSLKITANDYTFSKSNFIGWCKDQVRYFGKITGAIPADFRMYPYSFKLLEYQQRER